MLDRSGIGSELVAQNSVPDDPYQSIEGAEDQRSASHNAQARTSTKIICFAVKVFRALLFKVRQITFLTPCPFFAWLGSRFQSDTPQKKLPLRRPQIVRDRIPMQMLIRCPSILSIIHRHHLHTQMSPNHAKLAWRSFRRYSCLIWDGRGSRRTRLLGPGSRQLGYCRGQEDILQHRQNHGFLFSHFHSKVDLTTQIVFVAPGPNRG
jgi:hypothetical protein